ncbi:MAG: tetratricopeptide repeat protein, partial [Spirochaetia bacterium]
MSYVKKYYFLYPVPAAVLFCLIFFFMALAPPVFGENDESVEETSSQTGESEWRSFSINEKEDWLAEHREDPLFFNRLIETAESFENPSLSKELLHRYLSLIDDSGERHEALLMLARIEESLGNYKAAQSHYQSAALVRSEERDYEALYSSALLLIEQGDYSLAKVQLNRVLDNTESEELMRKAQLNLARLYALSGKHEQARSSIEGIMEESPSPEI